MSAGDDETIRIWDLAAGKETACHSLLGYRATVLTASPSGTTLAAGCADGTVRCTTAGATGTLPDWADAPMLAGHVHGITAMSFDDSGRLPGDGEPGRDRAHLGPGHPLGDHRAAARGGAAVVSSDGTWRGLGETDGLIWQAVGLTRVPLPFLEADT